MKVRLFSSRKNKKEQTEVQKTEKVSYTLSSVFPTKEINDQVKKIISENR